MRPSKLHQGPYISPEYKLYNCSPFDLQGLTLIPAWISNHMPRKMWNEITFPFTNLNGSTVEVWEWTSNFITHIIMDVMTYPCWDLSLTMLVKGATGNNFPFNVNITSNHTKKLWYLFLMKAQLSFYYIYCYLYSPAVALLYSTLGYQVPYGRLIPFMFSLLNSPSKWVI